MSKWISVEDDLPADGEDVLMFLQMFRGTQLSIEIGFHDTAQWYDQLERERDSVTHYMLLPDPPEVENDAS